MVDLNSCGRTPIGMLVPVIRNWTTYNRRIAAKRRCYLLLYQLPCSDLKRDFCMRVNTEIPQKIELVELEIKAAILNGDFGNLLTNHTMKVPVYFGA